MAEALETAKSVVSGKGAEKFISYFQSYTGTYSSLGKLRALYNEAIYPDDIVALSIATRPDCLSDDVVMLLGELNMIKPVFVELGLQTVHEQTAEYIRRGYGLPEFNDAVKRLKAAGIEVVVHMIIGLPGETDEMIVQTADYIGKSGADGIKFQLLYVLEGTDLAEDYREGKFEALSMEHYISLLVSCVEVLPENMVVHRLTGDAPKRNLIAPLWSANKKMVINEISKVLCERDSQAP